ncbi:MAG: DNA replication and repair protein RecF [Verrucomicrobiota bacterium]
MLQSDVFESVYLQHFRCHDSLEVKGLQQVNVLRGQNGSGKTTLLEALYFLARCKSFRTSTNKDLICWGQKSFGLRGNCLNGDMHKKLKVEWSVEGRKLSLDEHESVNFSQWWRQVLVIVVTNQDKRLVEGPGQTRRSWADGLLATIAPEYLPLIQRTQTLLKQKAALLKEEKPDRILWKTLTEQLREFSQRINEYRKNFTEETGVIISEFYSQLTQGHELLEMKFDSQFEKAETLKEEELWEREINRRAPQLGPHRDDWLLILEKSSMRSFGSEGQQKSAALALRLAELELIQQETQRWPVILLDDPLNELDIARVERFWSYLPRQAQIFYATPQEDSVHLPEDWDLTVWQVDHNQIKC